MQLNLFAKHLHNKLSANKTFLVYIPLVVYWGIIFTATTIPTTSLPQLFDAQDKLEHFAAYFILEILLALTLFYQNRFYALKNKPISYSILFLCLYAAIDELHQLLVPGRFADIYDWTADVIGGLLAITILSWFFKSVKKLQNDLVS